MILVGALRWSSSTVDIRPLRGGAYAVTLDGIGGASVSLPLTTAAGLGLVARLRKLVRDGRIDVVARSGRASFDVTIESAPLGPAMRLRRRSAEPAQGADGVGVDAGEHRLVTLLCRTERHVVYRTVHRVLGRAFALKLALSSTDDVARQNLAIVREGRLLARIDDPAIVLPCGVATLADGRMGLVLELREGETLASLRDREGSLEPVRAVAFARRIVHAVHACHSSGVAHGGVSSENVLVEAGERIALVGFGAASDLFPGTELLDLEATKSVVEGLVGTPLRAESLSSLETELAAAQQRLETPAWRRWFAR